MIHICFDQHHMEPSNNAHNKTPGATATGATATGAELEEATTPVAPEEAKVASTSISRLNWGDFDPVRHHLHIPTTVDNDSAMSTSEAAIFHPKRDFIPLEYSLKWWNLKSGKIRRC